jgi:hypothetical protein
MTMSLVRRLVSLCLTLAFAGYGLVMAAPAHAHGHHDNHSYAMHVMSLDADVVADDDHGHSHDEAVHDHDGVTNKDGSPADHGGFHVHAVSVFTTVDEPLAVPQTLSSTLMRWRERPAVGAAGLFSPLKRPPRIRL